MGAASMLRASSPVIGMASVQSGVILDNSRVSGTATLFEGSKIQAQGYSRLHLNNGTRLDLAAGTQAQVFANHASLEAGTGEIEGSGYEVDARTLRIRLTEKNTIARVKVDSADKRVYVTAVNAPVDVRNSSGFLIAKVAPGAPFSFMPQAAAPNSFDMYGCVLQKNGAAIASDSTGSLVSELRGFDLRNAVGKNTHIVGSIDPSAQPAAGASQVVKVTSATYSPRSGCMVVASRLGASTLSASLRSAATTGAGVATAAAPESGSGEGQAGASAPGGTGGGSGQAGSTASGAGWGTKAAIIGGVAAATAATLGGLAAAGVIFSSSP
jgi:hypothetical protein